SNRCVPSWHRAPAPSTRWSGSTRPQSRPGQRASKSLTQAVHSGGMASKEKPRSGASCFLPVTALPTNSFPH
ncbi:MAG: hypothetical protein ACRDC6_15700, partial [Shewanella sp.]